MRRETKMAVVTFVLLTVVTLGLQTDTERRQSSSHRRIERAIGGERFQRGRWPWLVLLKATIVTSRLFGIFPTRHYHLYCGGALISDQWVITAAHCFTENGDAATRPWNWEARMAAVRLRPSMTQRVLDVIGRVFDQDSLRQWEVDVQRIVIHPGHNSTSLLNDDIALVKLSEPIPSHFQMIQSISLPEEDEENFPQIGQTCITKGWGCTSRGGGPSHHAQQIEMPIYAPSQCSYHYSLTTMDKRICAGHRNMGVGVCRGDSGSPLVCLKGDEYTLAGIVSFTSRNRPDSFPAVFTKVQDYISWINTVLEGFN